MPKFLKNESIRLLESGIEILTDAMFLTALPKRRVFRNEQVENSGTIGLVGASIEQIMSAILVETYDHQHLELKPGYYKTGGMILDDFKSLIRNRPERKAFLFDGVEHEEAHFEKILSATEKFKLIITARAGGLHAGIGPSKDVCIVLINEIIDFCNLLGQSKKLKPYFKYTPPKIITVRERSLIIDEILEKLNKSDSTQATAASITSLFLVLPEIPSDEPEWIDSFTRLTIAPKENDLVFLIDTLNKASKAKLIRVKDSNYSIPVVIKSGAENALPIEPQYLKTSFTSIKDRFYTTVGNSNGTLEAGHVNKLDIMTSYELFAFGVKNLLEDSGADCLTAHQSWVFIFASLSYQGTIGPYFFLIRYTKDISQLKAILRRVSKQSGAYFNKNYAECLAALKLFCEEQVKSTEEKSFKLLEDEAIFAESKRENFDTTIVDAIGGKYELNEDAIHDFKNFANGDIGSSEMILRIMNDEYESFTTSHKNYWINKVIETCYREEDIPGVAEVLLSFDQKTNHSRARKALRIIDYYVYGPRLKA